MDFRSCRGAIGFPGVGEGVAELMGVLEVVEASAAGFSFRRGWGIGEPGVGFAEELFGARHATENELPEDGLGAAAWRKGRCSRRRA